MQLLVKVLGNVNQNVEKSMNCQFMQMETVQTAKLKKMQKKIKRLSSGNKRILKGVQVDEYEWTPASSLSLIAKSQLRMC